MFDEVILELPIPLPPPSPNADRTALNQPVDELLAPDGIASSPSRRAPADLEAEAVDDAILRRSSSLESDWRARSRVTLGLAVLEAEVPRSDLDSRMSTGSGALCREEVDCRRDRRDRNTCKCL